MNSIVIILFDIVLKFTAILTPKLEAMEKSAERLNLCVATYSEQCLARFFEINFLDTAPK